MTTQPRKFYRSRNDRMIAGVCGGIAEYLAVDPVFIRLIALLLLFIGNVATLITYIVMAVVIPERPAGDPATPAAEGATSTGTQSYATAPPAPPIPPAPATADRAVGTVAPASAAVEQRSPEAARRAGLIGGLVLIGMGLVFLAAQFVPGIAWWSMWPFIIVFAGVVQCVTPGRQGWSVERFFDGLGTIAVGLILLGNVTGYISWRVWWVLVSLWPVFLISIGLNILGKGLGQSWLKAMGSLVILASFVYAASLAWVGAGELPTMNPWVIGGTGEPYAYTEPAAAVSSATFRLQGAFGDIRISDGTDLVSISGQTPFGTPEFSATTSGDSADVRVTAAGDGPVIIAPGIAAPTMNVELGDTPVWDLRLATGASSLAADLTDVGISSLILESGVSDSSIRLGPVPAGQRRVPVLLKSGVAAVEVLVPEDVEARIVVADGLSSNKMGDRFEKSGDHWETPGYSSSTSGYDIRIEAGIGSVSVQTY